MHGFDRITVDPNVMEGKACIRGLRVTVSLVFKLVGRGLSAEEIVAAYPYLEIEDIEQALQFAAWLMRSDYTEARQLLFADLSLDEAIKAIRDRGSR